MSASFPSASSKKPSGRAENGSGSMSVTAQRLGITGPTPFARITKSVIGNMQTGVTRQAAEIKIVFAWLRVCCRGCLAGARGSAQRGKAARWSDVYLTSQYASLVGPSRMARRWLTGRSCSQQRPLYLWSFRRLRESALRPGCLQRWQRSD